MDFFESVLLIWAILMTFWYIKAVLRLRQNMFVINALLQAAATITEPKKFVAQYFKILGDTPDTAQTPVKRVYKTMRQTFSLPQPERWYQDVDQLESSFLLSVKALKAVIKDN